MRKMKGSKMPPNDKCVPDAPVTAEDHQVASKRHRARAVDLKLMIDNGLIGGLDPTKHQRLAEEFVDELACMVHHFSMARLARELET